MPSRSTSSPDSLVAIFSATALQPEVSQPEYFATTCFYNQYPSQSKKQLLTRCCQSGSSLYRQDESHWGHVCHVACISTPNAWFSLKILHSRVKKKRFAQLISYRSRKLMFSSHINTAAFHCLSLTHSSRGIILERSMRLLTLPSAMSVGVITSMTWSAHILTIWAMPTIFSFWNNYMLPAWSRGAAACYFVEYLASTRVLCNKSIAEIRVPALICKP